MRITSGGDTLSRFAAMTPGAQQFVRRRRYSAYVDRMAEVQERAAVLERRLREVRDELAGQTVDVAEVRRTLREFDRLWAERG